MDTTRLQVTHFSQPVRQILLMLIVVGLVGFGAFLVMGQLLPILTSNLWLNGLIVSVFVVGVISCFVQVGQLVFSTRWIENFAQNGAHSEKKAPLLLAPLANLLGSRSSSMQLSATSTRSILDSVGTRIEEAREITRYIVSLLIFLGLLGTFYGLATTVPALVETIRSLAPQDGESGFEVFNRLMGGLESQLEGMGIAFSSSLLGLAGSLVVGLLELFAGHGQNRFYRELEEWLSSITRISFAGSDSEGETSVVAAVLDHMVEQMEQMKVLFAQAEVGRTQVDGKLAQLADSMERLTQRMEASATSNDALSRVADGQAKLITVLEKMEHASESDAEARMRLRSLDVQLLRLSEEIAAGRQESIVAIRSDITALTNSILRATEDFDKDSGR